MNAPIKVLIVDDSALVREVLTQGLAADPDLEIVGTAADPFEARDLIVRAKPDVLTLDVEMPRMDGVEFLRQLMPQYPLPVIMVSALTKRSARITMQALEAGALDFVTKPTANIARGLDTVLMELRTKIKIAATANVSHWKRVQPPPCPASAPLAESTQRAVLIGASTGGTEAIRRVITQLPVSTPGCVVVQHMPPGYTAMFAVQLNQQAAMEVKEASDGDRIMPGRVLIAPGGHHLRISRSGGLYQVSCRPGAPVHGQCPAVDVTMESAATALGPHAVAILMTGMGSDGAAGMLKMREAGARTLAQDQQSSVVYGMPKAAWELGAAERQVPLDAMAGVLLSLLRQKVTV